MELETKPPRAGLDILLLTTRYGNSTIIIMEIFKIVHPVDINQLPSSLVKQGSLVSIMERDKLQKVPPSAGSHLVSLLTQVPVSET